MLEALKSLFESSALSEEVKAEKETSAVETKEEESKEG